MKLPNFVLGLIQDFKDLREKIEGKKWETFLGPNGETWFPVYSESGSPRAEMVKYEIQVPMDEQLAIDGDLESAIRRGVARKRVVSYYDVKSGLISREELAGRGKMSHGGSKL